MQMGGQETRRFGAIWGPLRGLCKTRLDLCNFIQSYAFLCKKVMQKVVALLDSVLCTHCAQYPGHGPVLQALPWEFTSLCVPSFGSAPPMVPPTPRSGASLTPSSPDTTTHGSPLLFRVTCPTPVDQLPGMDLGRPHNHKRGITRDMVISLLLSNRTDLLAFSNKNVVNTLTHWVHAACTGSSDLQAGLQLQLQNQPPPVS